MARTFNEIPDVGGFFFNFKERGDVAEGTLVKVREEQTKFGQQKVYDLLPDGSTEQIAVGGTHDIDQKMGQVKVGDYVRVTFREEIPLAGGKSVKKFKVEVAAGEPTPAVPAAKAGNPGKAPF